MSNITVGLIIIAVVLTVILLSMTWVLIDRVSTHMMIVDSLEEDEDEFSDSLELWIYIVFVLLIVVIIAIPIS